MYKPRKSITRGKAIELPLMNMLNNFKPTSLDKWLEHAKNNLILKDQTKTTLTNAYVGYKAEQTCRYWLKQNNIDCEKITQEQDEKFGIDLAFKLNNSLYICQVKSIYAKSNKIFLAKRKLIQVNTINKNIKPLIIFYIPIKNENNTYFIKFQQLWFLDKMDTNIHNIKTIFKIRK